VFRPVVLPDYQALKWMNLSLKKVVIIEMLSGEEHLHN
jgi:hypothetical protein